MTPGGERGGEDPLSQIDPHAPPRKVVSKVFENTVKLCVTFKPSFSKKKLFAFI